MTTKQKPKCAVNGCFRRGKLMGMCRHISVSSESICHAHGNLKCEHKIPVTQKWFLNKITESR